MLSLNEFDTTLKVTDYVMHNGAFPLFGTKDTP